MKAPQFTHILKAAAITAYLMSAAYTAFAQQAPPEHHPAQPPSPAKAVRAPDESQTPPAAAQAPDESQAPTDNAPASQASPVQQPPAQNLRCQTGEVLQQGQCVARKASPKPGSGLAQQSSEEHHPRANPPQGGALIPRCKHGETVVGNHCVKQ